MLSVSGAILAGPYTVVGTTWNYTVTIPNAGTGPYTRTVIGPTTVDGVSVIEVDTTFGGETDKRYVTRDGSGNYVAVEEDTVSSVGEVDDAYSPPQVIFPASMTAGVNYEYTSTETETNAIGHGTPVVSTLEQDLQYTLASETPTSLSVPYGTLKVYHVHEIETDTRIDDQGNSTVHTSSVDDYCAPGIGIVKVLIDNGSFYELDSFVSTSERLNFAQEPTDTDKDATIAPIQVSVLKSTGAVDTDAVGTITVSLNSVDGDGKLTGTVNADLVNGVATFNDLKVDAGGTYTLSAVDDATPPVTMAVSDEFDIDVAALTWTGAGDGVNWSDPKNWDGNVKPVNGDSLIFPDGSPLSPNNDLTGLSLASIDIQGSGYKLSGNAISLTSDLTSEAGNNTYNIDTKLVGSPTIDDQTGDLDIKSVLSGDGLTVGGNGEITFDQEDTYTGPTTLNAGITIDDDVLTDAFGSGDITIGAGAKPVTIDAGVSGGVTAIANKITFQDGATLATDPEVDLSGFVSVNGMDYIQPTNPSDLLSLENATIQGFGTLTVRGEGKVFLSGNLPSPVSVIVESGELDLGATLLGGANQIRVTGGTVKLQSSLSGSGGIDVKYGTLMSDINGTAYSGSVTLESSNPHITSAVLTPNTNVLGTGSLIVGTVPTTGGVNYPIISTATTGQLVALNNAVTFQSGAGLTVMGQVNFTGTGSVGGSADLYTVAGTDAVTFSGGLDGSGTLTLGGPATFEFHSDLAADVVINATTGATGQNPGLMKLNLGANLTATEGVTQIIADCAVTAMTGLAGAGGIELQGGTLLSGTLPGYSGDIQVDTSFFGLSATNSPTVTVTSATPLGIGKIVVAGPDSGSLPSPKFSAPTIDATGVAAGVTLKNTITLKDGGELHLKGNVTLSNALSLTGTAALFPLLASDVLTITKGVTGTGTWGDYGGGTTNLSGDIASTANLIVNGTLNLGANLLSTAASSQVMFSGSTLTFKTGLAGTGGMDVSGTLQTAGTVAYTGNITLEGSAIVQLTANPNALGIGQLIIASHLGSTIDASGTLQGITLNNALVFQSGGAALHTNGFVTFTDVVTLGGGNSLLAPQSASDQVVFKLGITGAGTLVIDGPGTTTINGDIADGVQLFDAGLEVLSPEPAVLNLGGNLLGPAGGASQVTVSGGTLNILSTLQGTGGIDLRAGTIQAGGTAGYTGTVLLEQQSPNLFTGIGGISVPGATITLTSSSSPLGMGPIALAAPVAGLSTTSNSPTIDASGAPGGAVLNNPLNVQPGAVLTTAGTMNFSGLVTLVGASGFVTTNASDQLTFSAGVQGIGTMTVGGVGTTTVTAALVAGVGVLTADSFTGTLEIGGALSGVDGGPSQLTVSAGRVSLLSTMSGSGGIEVHGGTLISSGVGVYNGTITLNPGGTIKDLDNANDTAYGTGNMILAGGLLQNAATATAFLNNDVSVTGDVMVSSRNQVFKFDSSLTVNGGASLDVIGSLVLTGALKGSGTIILDGDLFGVTTSNPNFTGTVMVHSGLVQVLKGQNEALGTGPLIANLTALCQLQSPTKIDPVLNNPLTIAAGTFVIDGQLNFPAGVTVNSGATLDIEGADSNVIISGPLAGGGNVVIGSGNLTMPGGSTSFTGGISLKGDINRDGTVDAKDLNLLNAAMGTAGAQPQDGDANGDGNVNFADLVAVAQHYGQQNATLAKGDFNGDGTVDFSDLVAVAQHYGHSGRADLNGDGIVNFEDFQILELAYGLTLPLTAPAAAPQAAELAPFDQPVVLPVPLASSPQPAISTTPIAPISATPSALKAVPARKALKDKKTADFISQLPAQRPVLKTFNATRSGQSKGSDALPTFGTIPIQAATPFLPPMATNLNDGAASWLSIFKKPWSV
jgi:hypothetical protein